VRGYLLTFSFVKKVKLAFLFYLPKGKEEKADWQLSNFFFLPETKRGLTRRLFLLYVSVRF
jgi:hypothetical protein